MYFFLRSFFLSFSFNPGFFSLAYSLCSTFLKLSMFDIGDVNLEAGNH